MLTIISSWTNVPPQFAIWSDLEFRLGNSDWFCLVNPHQTSLCALDFVWRRAHRLSDKTSCLLGVDIEVVTASQWILRLVSLVNGVNSILAHIHEARHKSPAAPRPVAQNVPDRGHRYSLAQRIQCLTLISEGFASSYIKSKTGVEVRSQARILQRAVQRGYRPEDDPRILEIYVVDGERSGRPKSTNLAKESEPLASASEGRAGREQSNEVLASEASQSQPVWGCPQGKYDRPSVHGLLLLTI